MVTTKCSLCDLGTGKLVGCILSALVAKQRDVTSCDDSQLAQPAQNGDKPLMHVMETNAGKTKTKLEKVR